MKRLIGFPMAMLVPLAMVVHAGGFPISGATYPPPGAVRAPAVPKSAERTKASSKASLSSVVVRGYLTQPPPPGLRFVSKSKTVQESPMDEDAAAAKGPMIDRPFEGADLQRPAFPPDPVEESVMERMPVADSRRGTDEVNLRMLVKYFQISGRPQGQSIKAPTFRPPVNEAELSKWLSGKTTTDHTDK